MSRKNKSYLAELKYQAVGDYLSGEGPLREICKKYGIRDKHTLQDWIKLYNGHNHRVLGSGTRGESAEKQRLRLIQLHKGARPCKEAVKFAGRG